MTRRFLLSIGLILLVSCKEVIPPEQEIQVVKPQEKKVFNTGIVFADNEFSGARLNDFKQKDDSTYQVFINPENTPINKSPWFSFRLWSEVPTQISLEFVYPDDYKHRYIPKLSSDGKVWKKSTQNQYQIDSINGTFKIDLQLTSEKLWVSAQENLTAQYTWDWADSLAKKDFIDQEKIGESVLGKPLTLLRIKKATTQKAIIFTARQHPPEITGATMALMTFVQMILSDSDLAQRFRDRFEVLIFPLVNPDGVENGHWRHNANGVDLNRDWISFSQPETKAVRDWLINAKNRGLENEYCFGIDFHSSTRAYLLTLDTIPHKVKPDITTHWIEQIELERNEKLDIRPRAQSLPYGYNWMINGLDIEAVTYEEADETNRAVLKKRAEDYANELMKVLLDKYFP